MEISLLSLTELGRRAGREKVARVKKGKWGAWYLSKNKKDIVINRQYVYAIPLERIKSEGPINWLAHMREKTWLERGDLEDFMQSLDDMLDIYNCLYGKK